MWVLNKGLLGCVEADMAALLGALCLDRYGIPEATTGSGALVSFAVGVWVAGDCL